mgnify:CR=1 FL=1
MVLDQNYRSTQTILDAANAVISNNPGRKEKHLWSDRGVGSPIIHYHAEDEGDEAVGGCGIHQEAAQFRCNAEVGWWLAEEHWGRGVTTRVATALAESALRKLQRSWTGHLEGDADAAWALLSQCVGALVVARVMESERTRKEVLAANRRVAERLARSTPDQRLDRILAGGIHSAKQQEFQPCQLTPKS